MTHTEAAILRCWVHGGTASDAGQKCSHYPDVPEYGWVDCEYVRARKNGRSEP